MSANDDRIQVSDRVVIYARGKKGIYVADFWEGNCHRRKSLQTTNRKEAVRRATKLANDLLQGTFRPAIEPVSPAEGVERYLAHLRTENRARKTLVKYEGILKLFTEFLDRGHVRRLGGVTAGHFDRYRAERTALRHRKTVYCESIVVKQFLKWAKTRKLVAENPLADVKLDKPRLELHPGPSLDQVNLILAKATGLLKDMLTILAFTGMRSGELLRLKPEDVDLKGNWILVVSREGAETKNRSSRKVPLHSRLRAVLKAMPKGQERWVFAADPSVKSPAVGGINAKQLNQQFVALAKSIGLPTGRKVKGFVVHSLRHFFETFCVNSGVPQRAVDVWMGHAPDKSMAAVYYELKDEESQAFMTKVPFGAGPPAADAGKEEK